MNKKEIQRIKALLFVLLIFSIPAFCGCADEDQNSSVPKLEIEEEYLVQDFDSKKYDIQIPVNTNLSRDEWRVTSSEPDWCMAAKVIDEHMIRLYVKLHHQSTNIRLRSVNWDMARLF